MSDKKAGKSTSLYTIDSIMQEITGKDIAERHSEISRRIDERVSTGNYSEVDGINLGSYGRGKQVEGKATKKSSKKFSRKKPATNKTKTKKPATKKKSQFKRFKPVKSRGKV